MEWRAGSDIGGTFTDIAYIDERGVLNVGKVPTTPDSFGRGVMNGLRGLAETHSLALSEMSEMVHGCTVATNAILEGKGARTALITTRGFRDVLELRRIRVPALYDPLYVKPAPLAPRNLRFEADERIDARGTVIEALDEEGILRIAQVLRQHAVEAVSVCFLHSYANPAHERRVGEILRAELPGIFISLSVDILPQIREYERTSTAVINAYVGPTVRHYLENMTQSLREADCRASVAMMQSSGGTVDAASVLAKPAQIVECGPAAGVVGAAYLCGRMGIGNAITFDMGGTTAKASLIEDGAPIYAENYEVGSSMSSAGSITGGAGYALKLPVIDISEVGAGGGSIVRIDRAGAIKVGPESAGAVPGPACYGTGGTEPTVTDANVVLGFLDQAGLAGGTVPIRPDLSRAAIDRVVAQPLAMPTQEAAFGIHQLANATMVRAIKAVTTYRGRDPRDFVMFAFGGNGGVHGVGLARSLEIKRVIVPPAAGVFSAVGLMVATRSVSVAAAFHASLASASAEEANAGYDRLRAEADQLLGLAAGAGAYRLEVEMRYVGQAFELTVPLLAERFREDGKADLREAFEAEHARRFGHRLDAGNAVEIVSLKLRATDPARMPPDMLVLQRDTGTRADRQVYFGSAHGSLMTRVVDRGDLPTEPCAGPLIVDEYEGTTVVPPDASVHRDTFGNIVIDLHY
ncbi:hydantoinase/oxoprolinase family protein [Seohaeicola zhoushanensis]|uniref:5-oxoprolinase n=1 Tax=Seohaeicola zhoushanensis TaxID=1569283 RepID=A0A8J3GWQ9_9RHOB|nr:hydantoinase/oxoprolinase family protein [Seohaeicola zhoushanensis]GHF49766.1 5-oxoprolinase [Seohaeicola zhoushanensis]